MDKKINWSSVNIDEGLDTLDRLVEHTNKAVKLYEKMQMLFRVAKTFPDIQQENKKFHLLPADRYSAWQSYVLFVDGEPRRMTRKQHDYIVKGKPYESNAAVLKRQSENSQHGAAPGT